MSDWGFNPISDINFLPSSEPVYLGFDRNRFPGMDGMRALWDAGFRFTSYWLNDPKNDALLEEHRSLGRRAELNRAGWGFLVLYWGKQPKEIEVASWEGINDATTATRIARSEGFPKDTIIFLDIEIGGWLSREYINYVSQWAHQVRQRGFAPGVYCSACGTAEQLRQTSGSGDLVFWVFQDRHCPSPGCVVPDPLPHPALSGVPFASVWQYARSPRGDEMGFAEAKGEYGYEKVTVEGAVQDYCYARGKDGKILADERGEKLFLDLNVATSADPSRGRVNPYLVYGWPRVLRLFYESTAQFVVGIYSGLSDLIASISKSIVGEATHSIHPNPSVMEQIKEFRQGIKDNTVRYRVPTPAEACAMGIAFSLLIAGDPKRANEIASRYGYRAYRTSTDGRSYLVLAPHPRLLNPTDKFPAPAPVETRSWGLYLFAEDAENARGNTLVEIPHPVDDEETEYMGVAAFTDGMARALFLAGSRRDALTDGGTPGKANVARVAPSVFQAIHERAVDYLRCGIGPPPKVLQLHGFSRTDPDTGEEIHANCPDVFVSAGSRDPEWQHEPQRVVQALEEFARGRFSVRLYDTRGSCDADDSGDKRGGLAATDNEQGKYCRVLLNGRPRAWFVHVEVVKGLRDDTRIRDEIAMRAVFALDGRPPP